MFAAFAITISTSPVTADSFVVLAPEEIRTGQTGLMAAAFAQPVPDGWELALGSW